MNCIGTELTQKKPELRTNPGFPDYCTESSTIQISWICDCTQEIFTLVHMFNMYKLLLMNRVQLQKIDTKASTLFKLREQARCTVLAMVNATKHTDTWNIQTTEAWCSSHSHPCHLPWNSSRCEQLIIGHIPLLLCYATTWCFTQQPRSMQISKQNVSVKEMPYT